MYQFTAMNYTSEGIMQSNTNQDLAECSMALDMENHVDEEHEIMDSSGGSTNQDMEACTGEERATLESCAGDLVQEPYEGMEFESEEAARIYYNKYAMSVGFGSRISRNRRSRKDGETIARNFVCCKEGYRLKKGKDNEGRVRRNRAVTREGCGAMITVKKTNVGKWVVSKFVKDHNHALLSPNEVSALRSHREVSKTPKRSDPDHQSDKEREIIEKLEGDGNLEPYEGMELESEDAARVFYSAYARRLGFRSRISKNRRSRKDGEIIARKFVCYREGYRAGNQDNKKERIYRPRAVVRQGCEAMIYVKKTNTGKWVVSKFVKEHNHPMIDQSKVCSHRSDGTTSSNLKSITVASNGVRAGLNDMASVVGSRGDGGSNGSMSEPDDCNHIQNIRKRKRCLGGKDPEDVLDYLERMQSENPAFFYATKVDEDDLVHCIFWVDPRSRMAYNYFGDVVYFDTTYKTDQFEVPFVSFLGINHHQQSTLFGSALLFDETESSYVWLFNMWLEAMSGRHPITVVSNLDEVIGTAIAQVFPKSHHCFSKMHILNQAPKQLAHLYRAHPAFKEEFQKCINMVEDVNEFESQWESLIQRYKLWKNEWLLSVYNGRRKLVPVYLRDVFFARESDILNSFFDGYVKENTSFEEFVVEYEKALACRYEKELEEDIRTTHTKPVMKTRLPLEKQASDSYTRTMFLKFQDEIYESLGYVANKIKEDGAITTYCVAKYEDQQGEYTVTYNAPERKANCSCQMFESSGILCRHALIVFTVSNVVTLPSHYILERWTRNAKSVVGLDRRGVAMQANCRKSPTLRYSVLCKQAIRCAEVGSTSIQDYDVAVRALREAWEKIIALKKKAGNVTQVETPVYGNLGDNTELTSEVDNPFGHIAACNPPQPKRRGRPPKNSNLNSNLEKPTTNTRKCSICKEHGHDNTNCPRLRPLGGNFSTGGMFVVDAGPSDLHAHAGMAGEHTGFSEQILGLSLGDHFDSNITQVMPSFAPTSFFQIASLANPRHLNTNEEFSLTGARPSSGQPLYSLK